MKRFSVIFAAMAALVMFSCNKAETIAPSSEDEPNYDGVIVTKGMEDKTPEVFVYIETNDVNPLNAGDYYLGTKTFVDYVCLFSSNIHLDANNMPTVYFNPELVPYLMNGGANTYVKPLQQKNIGVLLGVLGDHVGKGLHNMTNDEADYFASKLHYVVNLYGLDGVCFDDEYSDATSTVSTSFSRVITQFRALEPDAIIAVFDWGETSTISSTAASEIDMANHGYFGSYLSYYYSDITGMNKSRWSPMSFNLGNTLSTSLIQSQATNAKNNSYGHMMFFNMRTRNDNDPLPYFQAAATGAGFGTVTCSGGNQSPATAASAGYTF